VATAACSLVSGMHVQGMQGLSTGRSPAAWNVIQAATRYACLCSTAASCREYSFLHVLLTFHMCAGTGLHCNGSQCMAEAFWRPMSQEGFIETCRVSTSKDDQLMAAQLLPDLLLSACSALTSLECSCRDILVRGAFILSSLELKVSNATFDPFECSKHLCVLCVLLCQSSCVAVWLLLVMSELQIVLVVSCCRAHQYAWLLEGHTISPSALGQSLLLTLLLHCSLLFCTAH